MQRQTRVPPGLSLARFLVRYPGLPFIGPWPTRDTIIPARLFALLAQAAPHVAALQRLDLTQAVGLGFGGDRTGSLVQRELRLAFPEDHA